MSTLSAKRVFMAIMALLAVIVVGVVLVEQGGAEHNSGHKKKKAKVEGFDKQISANAQDMLEEGRTIFRFDTFGDEAFWGDHVKLHQAIEGSKFGGVGPGLSPKAAVDLGLKVDVDALPKEVVEDLEKGKVNLNDPATTLALLKANAVLGVTGFFNPDGSLKSMGLQCSLCHSTVDNSLAFGIGHRLDGWANRDLDGGKLIASAPDLSAFADLLGVSQDVVRNVLRILLKSLTV